MALIINHYPIYVHINNNNNNKNKAFLNSNDWEFNFM